MLLATCALLAGSTVALATPASADVPEGWPPADSIDKLNALLLLGGIPLLLFVVIALAVYVPSFIRGESLAPGTHPVQDQWLGGSRKSAGELAGPAAEKSETSDVGGASGRW